MNEKESSPFTPGSPVPVELFVGRAEQVRDLMRYVGRAATGRQENVFLAGDRGIGKSSLAAFLRQLSALEKNMLGIHVFLGRVTTLEEMVHHIFEQLLKESKGESWFDDFTKFFGKYIKSIGLFGISVSFNPPQEALQELVRKFPEAIHNLLSKIKDRKSGLFIALDDINGLAEREEFAHWYKSFVDEVAVQYKDFPVFIVLIGLPERRDTLARLQPSLMRIFRVVEVERLSDQEVEEFLARAFESAGMTVEQDALKIMVQFSSGLPLLMHEIGDATFWVDTDLKVDQNDAARGVLIAAEKVGQKYLDPKVYRAIRSPRYRSILRKLGKISLSRSFSKSDVEKRLNADEQKVFHNFLRRFRELGVIEPDMEQGRGAYRFANEIYRVYIWMESQRVKKK